MIMGMVGQAELRAWLMEVTDKLRDRSELGSFPHVDLETKGMTIIWQSSCCSHFCPHEAAVTCVLSHIETLGSRQ